MHTDFSGDCTANGGPKRKTTACDLFADTVGTFKVAYPLAIAAFNACR
jgi:hypothetical protein